MRCWQALSTSCAVECRVCSRSGAGHGERRRKFGVTALGHFGVLLNTVNPNIKSIRDFTDKDRITVPAVKVSHQAIVLAMAAAKEWGFEHWARLDPLTVTMNAADQTTGLLSGGGGFNTSFASIPFTVLQLKDQRVRTVLNSWDIIGDITSSVLWSSKKFRDANPKVYRAVVEALKEATDIINADKKRAVTYYVQDSKTNMSVDELVALLQEPHYGLNVTPVGVQHYADFMHKTGRLSVAPKSWKDMFFEDIHDLDGS